MHPAILNVCIDSFCNVSLQVLGVPSIGRIAVKDLAGVDTTGKLVSVLDNHLPWLTCLSPLQVISTKDGFEILQPSSAGYNDLIKQGYN